MFLVFSNFFPSFDGFSKRDNDYEPVPTFRHWKQEFDIDLDPDRKVKIRNQTSDLDKDRDKSKIQKNLTVTKVRNKTIVLGDRNGLNIIALLPKKKISRE